MFGPWFSFIALFLSLAIASTDGPQSPMSCDQDCAGKITPPKLIEGERAEYPDDARIRQMDGLCSLSLIVGIRGDPRDVHVLHCTDPSFDESSVSAVSGYRFTPALTREGKPIAVTVAPLVLQYHFAHRGITLHWLLSSWIADMIPDRNLIIFDRRMSRAGFYRELISPVHPDFIVAQRESSGPGSDGIYSLSLSTTAPRVIEFAEEGYAAMAFTHEGNSACDVMITIDTRGKPSDLRVIHCERPELEKPAVESLLKSPYKAGYVQGKQVPIRAMIHLYYGDDPSVIPPVTQ